MMENDKWKMKEDKTKREPVFPVAAFSFYLCSSVVYPAHEGKSVV
jgi:hypothetical protein